MKNTLDERLLTASNKKERAIVDSEEFSVDNYTEKAGVSVGQLCKWVKVMYAYSYLCADMKEAGISTKALKAVSQYEKLETETWERIPISQLKTALAGCDNKHYLLIWDKNGGSTTYFTYMESLHQTAKRLHEI